MNNQIYLSTPIDSADQREAYQKLASLLSFYSFDLYHSELADQSALAENDFSVLVMPFDRSRMLLAGFYPDADGQFLLSPLQRFEIDEGYKRGLPQIAMVRGDIEEFKRQYPEAEKLFLKIIYLEEDEDDLLHPLMTGINRYFPPI